MFSWEVIGLKKAKEMPVEERLNAYDEAMSLRKKGKGPLEISNECGVNPRTVEKWIYQGCSPYNKLRVPDLSPSSDLSYVLGVYCGDGGSYCYRRLNEKGKAYYQILGVKDRDFARKFAECLSKILDMDQVPISENNGTYRVVVGNKMLHEFLEKPLEKHKSVIEEYPGTFLKAFFDGEGGAYENRISVCNTNLSLLKYISHLLFDFFSIESSLIVSKESTDKWKTAYALYIYGKENFSKFQSEIGFTIKRKQERLCELVKSRKNKKGGKGSKRGFKYSNKTIRKALSLKEEGLGYKRIGRKLGISPWTVREWVNRGRVPKEVEKNNG